MLCLLQTAGTHHRVAVWTHGSHGTHAVLGPWTQALLRCLARLVLLPLDLALGLRDYA